MSLLNSDKIRLDYFHVISVSLYMTIVLYLCSVKRVYADFSSRFNTVQSMRSLCIYIKVLLIRVQNSG